MQARCNARIVQAVRPQRRKWGAGKRGMRCEQCLPAPASDSNGVQVGRDHQLASFGLTGVLAGRQESMSRHQAVLWSLARVPAVPLPLGLGMTPTRPHSTSKTTDPEAGHTKESPGGPESGMVTAPSGASSHLHLKPHTGHSAINNRKSK